MYLPPKQSVPEGSILWLLQGPLMLALFYFYNNGENIGMITVLCLMAIMVIFREYAKQWRREKDGEEQ